MTYPILLAIVAVLFLALVLLWLYGERWHPLLPSTRAFMRAIGFPKMLRPQSLHGYIYGRWNRLYIEVLIRRILPRSSTRFKERLADRYHGKVLTHDQAKAIIQINQDVPLRDLEQIIPYPTARDLVLSGPPDIAVWECSCRATSATPCQPSQVCMVVGQPFVDFILGHRPHESRRLTQAEALDLLREEHERGHLHSAWFKDALLNRFYAICNCCKCCCAGIASMTKYDAHMMASSGYVPHIDGNICNMCEVCIGACPFDALSSDGGIDLEWDKCMGCGVCVGQCAEQAITLVQDERKGIPLDVRQLMQVQA